MSLSKTMMKWAMNQQRMLAAVLLFASLGWVNAQTEPAPGPTQAGTSTSCNNWHIVASGDSCSTLEAEYGITHAQFLTWNPAVSSDCISNFWADYAYCVGVGTAVPTTTSSTSSSTSATITRITSPAGPTFTGSPSNCNNWYVVQAGDNSCSTVETKFSITHAQFIAWNPAVSNDCLTNFWVGEAYCVGLGDVVTSSSSSSSTASTTTTTTTKSATVVTTTTPYSTRNPITNYTISTPTIGTEWPPTQTQAGQPSYCNDWHLVGPGETCADIVYQHSTWMSIDDFMAWNPAVLSDCSGLYLYWWVCVGIQPQTPLTISYPTGNATIPDYVTWTPTPLPANNASFTASPTQGPLPTNCNAYYKAQSGDTCLTILSRFNFITESQFFSWNSYLNNNCNGLWADTYYCVGAFGSDLPQPPTVTALPSPVQDGISSQCTAWYMMTGSDTCDLIATMFGTFSASDFISWNPAVNVDCSNLLNRYYYCVAIPGTPTSRTTSLPASTTVPSLATQTGIATNCDKYWLVSSVDTCNSIIAANSISLTDFLAWNPAVGNSTCSGLAPNYYVCVAVSTGVSTTTSSTIGSTTTPPTSTVSSTSTTVSTTTSSGGGSVTTPTPIQSGMVTGCVRFYYVESGDGCWAIANSAGIALDDFYAWNPAVQTDCSGLWSDVYVCIGLAGPATTITSGPPVPT